MENKKKTNNYYYNKRNNKQNRPQPSELEIVNLASDGVPPFVPVINTNFVSYGPDNNVYAYINQCFESSPTNYAIITTIQKLIVSDGLRDKNGLELDKYISNADVSKICLDYKKLGSFALQILWNADKTIGKVAYINVAKVFLQINSTGDVVGYYYSFDPKNCNASNTDWFPKFDGEYKEFEDEKLSGSREILVVQRPDSDKFFPSVDYQPGLPWASLENGLSTTATSFANQSFRGSTLVQMNSGIPPSEDLKRTYKKQIIDNLTGTDASGRVIIAFNQSADEAMSVENLDLPEISKTFELFSSESEQKLFVAHNVPPILFSGTKGGTGLGNNKEELESATASLMLRSINPMRKEIISGLNIVFKKINKDIDLEFKDFEIVVKKEIIEHEGNPLSTD